MTPPPRRAWLVAGGPDGGVAGRWRPAAGAPGPVGPGWPRLAVGGDLAAAETAAGAVERDPAWLEVADVIYHRGGPAGMPPPARLAGILDRYPGCAVAATSAGPRRYLAAARVARPRLVCLFMPNDYGFNALLSAMFVYGWLAAGWPLAALGRSRLEAIAAGPLAGHRLTPFGLFYVASAAGSS